MPITARPVGLRDVELICEHRERMFAQSGRTCESLRPMTAAFEQWLVPRLDDGSYFGWMLERCFAALYPSHRISPPGYLVPPFVVHASGTSRPAVNLLGK
jgi:hypothetical protein